MNGFKLIAANFEKADLEGGNLFHAHARDTNFKGANSANADLTVAYLGGANLSGANLKGAL